MGNVLLTTDEYNRLKAVVIEAQALRDYLDGVRKTALRITPYHIEMAALRGALAALSDIDLDNPRMSTPARVMEQLTWNDNMNTADTKPVNVIKDIPAGTVTIGGKPKDKPNANAKRRRTSTAQG